jgi:chitinase
MLLTGVAILLSLSTLIQAAAFPQTVNETMASSAATGYKNVAYFVNWAGFASQNMPKNYC